MASPRTRSRTGTPPKRSSRADERRARDERRERVPLLLAELDAFLARTGMAPHRLAILAKVGVETVYRTIARRSVPTLATMERLNTALASRGGATVQPQINIQGDGQ